MLFPLGSFLFVIGAVNHLDNSPDKNNQSQGYQNNNDRIYNLDDYFLQKIHLNLKLRRVDISPFLKVKSPGHQFNNSPDRNHHKKTD